jgi:hypothetical protein
MNRFAKMKKERIYTLFETLSILSLIWSPLFKNPIWQFYNEHLIEVKIILKGIIWPS